MSGGGGVCVCVVYVAYTDTYNTQRYTLTYNHIPHSRTHNTRAYTYAHTHVPTCYVNCSNL